ncbi:MAG TPA: carboxypeptidase regulatory-like domain-containing protein, partial [Bryobacteraceae bacterium]|nr:carboxypeptidase regulatory-like domain-containing protein [Bryobacteraceae bacterium]
VTPKSDDHSFEPTFRTFDSVSANQTADFSASPLYRISGRITNSSGAGVEGTTLNLGGTKTESRATDSNGNYSFISLPPGNYTVTPSRDGFTFTPEPRVYNNLSQNQMAADFTATTTATFTISGRITLGGAGVIGVTVNLSSGTQTKSTTTGDNGNYTFNGLAPGTYTVRPANWATSPGSITLTDVNGNGTADFSIVGREYIRLGDRVIAIEDGQ